MNPSLTQAEVACFTLHVIIIIVARYLTENIVYLLTRLLCIYGFKVIKHNLYKHETLVLQTEKHVHSSRNYIRISSRGNMQCMARNNGTFQVVLLFIRLINTDVIKTPGINKFVRVRSVNIQRSEGSY